MKQFRRASLLVTLVCLAFAGSTAAAEFPKGTFAAKDPDGKEWTLTFDGKGKVLVARGGKLAVEASYKATKDQVEFKDVKGPRADPSSEPGVYKWKLVKDALTFVKVKDEQRGRAEALTSAGWERKKE